MVACCDSDVTAPHLYTGRGLWVSPSRVCEQSSPNFPVIDAIIFIHRFTVQLILFIFYLFINYFIKRHKVVTSEAPFLHRDCRNHLQYSLHLPTEGVARLSGVDKYRAGRPANGCHQSLTGLQLNFIDVKHVVTATPNQPRYCVLKIQTYMSSSCIFPPFYSPLLFPSCSPYTPNIPVLFSCSLTFPHHR